METETIVMCVGFFIVGIIIFYLLRNSCGCNVVEGQVKIQSLEEGALCAGMLAADVLDCSNPKHKDMCPVTCDLVGSNGSADINEPSEVIGFLQSGCAEGDCDKGRYYYPSKDDINNSNYTILIEAFTVNYPFCWGETPDKWYEKQPGEFKGNFFDGCVGNAGKPLSVSKSLTNKGSPVYSPIQCGVISGSYFNDANTNEPGPLAWTGDNTGKRPGKVPDDWNKDYRDFYTNLHSTDPKGMRELRDSINSSHKQPLLLTSIGGWFMGGSTGDGIQSPMDKGMSPIGVCLSKPEVFAQQMLIYLNRKMSNIYDGIDLDIETDRPFGKNGGNGADEIASFVKEFKRLDKRNPPYKISTSPRLGDICDPYGNTTNKHFMGLAMKKLASENIFFDYVNPQCYNDLPHLNIPGPVGKPTTPGPGGINSIKQIRDTSNGFIGPNTTVSVGVLSQNIDGKIDTGGAAAGDESGNPGISNSNLKSLWDNIKIEIPGKKLGLMNWYANIGRDNKTTTEYLPCTGHPCAGFEFRLWANGLFGKDIPAPTPPPKIANKNFCSPDKTWGGIDCSKPCPGGKNSECSEGTCYGDVTECAGNATPPGWKNKEFTCTWSDDCGAASPMEWVKNCSSCRNAANRGKTCMRDKGSKGPFTTAVNFCQG